MIELFFILLDYTMRNKEYYINKWEKAQNDEEKADVLRELLIDLSEEI